MAKLPDFGADQPRLPVVISPGRGSGLPPGEYTHSETDAIKYAESRARDTGNIHFVYRSSRRRPGYEYRIVSNLYPSLNFERTVAVTNGKSK